MKKKTSWIRLWWIADQKKKVRFDRVLNLDAVPAIVMCSPPRSDPMIIRLQSPMLRWSIVMARRDERSGLHSRYSCYLFLHTLHHDRLQVILMVGGCRFQYRCPIDVDLLHWSLLLLFTWVFTRCMNEGITELLQHGGRNPCTIKYYRFLYFTNRMGW